MQDDRSRRIVVGVDGSPCSKKALRWAIAAAQATGATVQAVAAWQDPAIYGYACGWAATAFDGDNIGASTEKALAESIAEMAGYEGPPVEIGALVVRGRPAQVLTDAVASAQMLVVGSRGRGTFAGILLGSVSQHCIQQASGPPDRHTEIGWHTVGV